MRLGVVVNRPARSNGRDYRVVRRPIASVPASALRGLTKAELVALADDAGLPAEGTKADLTAALTGVQANDATVTDA